MGTTLEEYLKSRTVNALLMAMNDWEGSQQLGYQILRERSGNWAGMDRLGRQRQVARQKEVLHPFAILATGQAMELGEEGHAQGER